MEKKKQRNGRTAQLDRLGLVARSLKTKLIVLALIFSAVPVILYRQFQDAYSENQRLIERSIQEQGRLITRAIDPLLLRSDQGSPPTPSELREALYQIAGDDITVRLLFSPQAAGDTESFYFVVATPKMSSQLLAETRQELIAQGVLDRLAPTCDGSVDEPIRYRTAAGTEELITFIDARMTDAGCWILITSNATSEFTQSALGIPYWMRPEAHSAAAIYAGMALITLSLSGRRSHRLRQEQESRRGRLFRESRRGLGHGELEGAVLLFPQQRHLVLGHRPNNRRHRFRLLRDQFAQDQHARR